jgi:hypothetical protein
MANNREITQLASFVVVNDTTKNISITSTETPYIGLGTADPQYKLDVNGDINFNGLLYQNGSQFVASRWTVGVGTSIYRLSSVGIGITNPTQTLDILGGLRVRGGIYDINNSAGLLNQVIVANGANGWTWQNPTGGGAGAAIQIDGGDPNSIYTSTPVIDAAGP